MVGDKECATGLPITAHKRVSEFMLNLTPKTFPSLGHALSWRPAKSAAA